VCAERTAITKKDKVRKIRYRGGVLFEKLTFIHDTEPHSAALNMAFDEALLLTADRPMVRVYRWAEPAVSFGYFGKYAPIAASWPGRAYVRRMTGGGVVLHGEDITYSIVVPIAHPFAQCSARESYCAIHGALAQWLAVRGVAASLAHAPEGQGNGVCFDSPAEADVIAGGRKLAGAAQRRTREGLLYQGSVQGVPLAWRGDIARAFSEVFPLRDFTITERELAGRLALEKYGTPMWLERV
jgi:lipoate-protein ligase A